MQNQNNLIKDSEHVFIAGGTGSGKTYMSRIYTAYSKKPVFIMDSKGTFNYSHFKMENTVITITRLADLPNVSVNNYSHIIYRPIFEELTQDFFNGFFKYCYCLKDCSVLVDELMHVCPSPLVFPEFYKGILTRGRELNINCYSLTQRPAMIPVLSYSESTHWFIFKLNAIQDRKRIADQSGRNEFLIPIPKHYFNYYNSDSSDEPQQGILINEKLKYINKKEVTE